VVLISKSGDSQERDGARAGAGLTPEIAPELVSLPRRPAAALSRGGGPSRREGRSRGGVPPGEEAGARRALFAVRYSPRGELAAALVSPARRVDALPRYHHAALLNIALLNTCPGTNNGWTNLRCSFALYEETPIVSLE
jgi:hypothetical protein